MKPAGSGEEFISHEAHALTWVTPAIKIKISLPVANTEFTRGL
jgi:hypothetical protein